MAPRKSRTIKVTLKSEEVSVYTSPRLADALEELNGDMDIYQGVKLRQILEAVYKQGSKDGARGAFEHLDQGVSAAKKAIPHVNPGRPRKK